jgi:hypothetical protein
MWNPFKIDPKNEDDICNPFKFNIKDPDDQIVLFLIGEFFLGFLFLLYLLLHHHTYTNSGSCHL